MIMEWKRSSGGNDVVELDKGAYISFGHDKTIKWIHLSYLDISGTRRGQMLPVTLNKVKREYSSVIGSKNLTKLRSLIRERLDGATLSRIKFVEIGEAINDERKGK